MEFEFEKYKANKKNFKFILQEFGVAIIPNVLNNIECQEMIAGIWDFLEFISKPWKIPLNRNDKNTWREFYKIYPLHEILLKNCNIGHAHISWNIRQNFKILEIFSLLWNVKPEELLVSFDNFTFNIPPEETEKGWSENEVFFNCNQSFTDNSFKCVQSFITGFDINENDGTFAFLEKSHNFHKNFATHFNIKTKKNLYKLNTLEINYYLNNNFNLKKIKCPKGSLVLWDSRMIYSQINPIKLRTQPNFLATIYLCYLPRKFATQKQVEKKVKAFEELTTTSYWPFDYKSNSKNITKSKFKSRNIKIIYNPILKEIGYKLAGY